MEDKGQSMRMKIRGFLARHMLPLLSVFTIATVVMAFVYLSHASKQIMQENAVTGAQRYLEALAEFRTLYTSEVIKTAKRQGLTISHNYQDIEGAIPLPATLSMALGKKIGAHQSGAKTYLYSRYPFPWRRNENQALFRQGFTRAAWQADLPFVTPSPIKCAPPVLTATINTRIPLKIIGRWGMYEVSWR